jgi:hypothetical protein
MQASHPERKEVHSKAVHLLSTALGFQWQRHKPLADDCVRIGPTHLRLALEPQIVAHAAEMHVYRPVRLLDRDEVVTMEWDHAMKEWSSHAILQNGKGYA